jgi:sterol desaturase/sphingolipid hydroxylase (fatty acid hydroxylase superfamily)
MNFNPIILSVPLFFFLIGIELLVESWKRQKSYRLNDAITNINMGTSQQTVGSLLKILIPLGIYEFTFSQFAIFQIKDTWLNYIILFIAYDFCYYWAHRMSHEINLLWSGHVVHHQSEEYNLAVALRQSWFSSILTAPFYVPLALAGFPTEMLVWVGAINLTYQFWIHTEAVDKLGFLEYFMNTPSHHRVHHGRNEKYIDRNHAGVFIVWDKMFGTFQVEEERPVYGITTPLASWNPLWANFSNYVAIYKQMQETPRFWDKVKVIFYPPGWRPAELGGQMPIPAVDRETTPKFNPVIPPALNYYALFQYFVITGGALAFFLTESKLPTDQRIICATLIIVAVVLNGAILEARRWAWVGEMVRLLLTLGIVYWILQGTTQFSLWIGVSASATAISFLWTLTLRKYFFLQK